MTAVECEKNSCLKTLSRNKNEENTECSINENSHCEDHDSTLGDELANVGFTNAREVEGGVLAVTNQGHNRVQRVLVRRKKIDTDGEWEDELLRVSKFSRTPLNEALTQHLVARE